MQIRNVIKLVYCLVAVAVLSGCVANEKKVSANKFVATSPVKEVHQQASQGSIYRGQASSFIFEDMKARRVGDILTIVLSEKTNAKKKATTSTKKDNSVDLGSPDCLWCTDYA